jgi:hypothetical protein
MLSRDRIFHKASVYAGNRKINLVLAAIPMRTDVSISIEKLCNVFKTILN